MAQALRQGENPHLLIRGTKEGVRGQGLTMPSQAVLVSSVSVTKRHGKNSSWKTEYLTEFQGE